MSQVSNAYIPTGTANIDSRNTQKNQAADGTSFDDLMAQAELKAGSGGYADQLLEALTRSAKMKTTTTDTSRNIFPFSSEFESVFGNSGPLIDFINAITAKLGLSAEKNKALQDIAIRNKDITYSAENVKKIGEELKQAGIG